ncbi:hypothetical protein MAR_028087 [Mya arenaria]|uniref:SGNH hydrolase-type esterase domain-containing protein n=1 Tax=Mya arenaria TaxID=6604 RepID=A0ABY7DCK1_MYAAR|nr:hypothetical protein MAR_028087 [Mya arenaria]
MPVKNLSTAGKPTSPNTVPTERPAQSSITKITERTKTLLIGSSIVKGIQPPGLSTKVELVKISGAKIRDVAQRLNEIDTRHYNDVIIHVGGNDVSDGKQPDASYREILNVTQKLQEQRCKVHLCTVCPRRDADVSEFNSRVRQVSRETGADLIDCYQALVYGNGDTVIPYFTRDGIHLTEQGSRTLVATVNSRVHIIRDRDERNSNSWACTI